MRPRSLSVVVPVYRSAEIAPVESRKSHAHGRLPR